MEGIEKLKSAIGAVIKVIKTVDLAMSDGKVSVIEGIKIAMSGLGFWNAVKNFKALKAEYADLSSEERDTLLNYFCEEFDLRDDKIEEIIEHIFGALLGLSLACDEMQ